MNIKVLDQGYVELVEAWGTGKAGVAPPAGEFHGENDYEVGIVEAARQSTQGSFRGWAEDEKLLETLFNHQSNQSTPFEAAGMTIEVQAPIFVFREWHRHRTQSYNEASGRYIQLPPLHYHPLPGVVYDRGVAAATAKNKQQAGTVVRTPTIDEVYQWLSALETVYGSAEAFYRYGLSLGIPKELARIAMPVGHYSRMRATANLRNWLGFLLLRMDSKAQWEIRAYANAVGSIIAQTFPKTWSLFHAKLYGE